MVNGKRLNLKTDVLIIGAGPSGCACAIQLLRQGKKVTIVDKTKFPRHAPGETLHPAIEPLLEKLGVKKTALKLSSIRHKGITNIVNGKLSYTPYNEAMSWKGFQFLRSELDHVLLLKAKNLGATVLFNHKPKKFAYDAIGKIVKVHFQDITIEPEYVIDAAGRSGLLAKRLNIGFDYYSPKLLAYYGLVKCSNNREFRIPELHWNESGWTWLASINHETTSWVRLDVFQPVVRKGMWLPDQIQNGFPYGKVKAADVTWRIAKRVSSNNWFLVGDAAFVLDPTSSHGVINAIMAGLFVSQLIELKSKAKAKTQEIHNLYGKWTKNTFFGDYKNMAKGYDHFFRKIANHVT
ncbi:MAG: NAD(P)/FAD-dependent oxidoreductase [Arenicella sp.]